MKLEEEKTSNLSAAVETLHEPPALHHRPAVEMRFDVLQVKQLLGQLHQHWLGAVGVQTDGGSCLIQLESANKGDLWQTAVIPKLSKARGSILFINALKYLITLPAPRIYRSEEIRRQESLRTTGRWLHSAVWSHDRSTITIRNHSRGCACWQPGPYGVIQEQTKDNDRVPSGAYNPPQLGPSWAFFSEQAQLSLLHSQLKGAQFIRSPSPRNSPP